MSAEDKTFNALRRIPVEDVLILLSDIKHPVASRFILGQHDCIRADYFEDIAFHLERVKIIEESGWTVMDFFLALEKRSIVNLINDYNASISFPQELIDRAKRSFPNLKFVHAKIDLGE